MSFESEKPFNDFEHFPRGIRRSGCFSIKESNILEECGSVMMDLYNGVRDPQDETEKTFVEQVKNNVVATDYYAKVFKKYLRQIAPRKTHNLTSADEDDSSFDSSDDVE
jgi:uncharacterized protein YifE (UPF0438 family)